MSIDDLSERAAAVGTQALAVLQRCEDGDPAPGIERTLSDSARVPGFDLEGAAAHNEIPDALTRG